MFGSEPRVRRPIILLLVFGSFLALIGITASAQAVMVSAHFSTATLNAVVGSDAATARALVNAWVEPAYLAASGGPSAADRKLLESQLASLTRPGEILRVELRRPDGTIVAADAAGLAGTVMPPSESFELAAAGEAQAAIEPADGAEAGPGALATPTLIREYLPLSANGQVMGVIAIWRDAVPVLDRLAAVRRDVVLVTLSAAIVAALLLYLVFRAAQGRLTRQTSALVESTRRDPLTSLLNHGALVAHLAREIETARLAGRPLGVALVDIDNFRLLNANHGHQAGDQALQALAELLAARLPAGLVVGRFGPDEFLLLAPAEHVVDLEPTVAGLRAALSDFSLQFEATERLPVTVSAGICHFPEHGASVSVLLSTAVQTLEEAKASGGDTTVVAGQVSDDAAASGAFDVLQGLVFAIDTKDRYTKRHSEDVARYGTFLAARLGLDPDVIRSVHVAGLLHDVGKIGVPDAILRKPGRLTEAEYEIVKQHVALGDAIVRDLSDIDVVRAGIRHHHERWDGEGYLERLEGEEIPLIARILAVGDAFSAMTTTRPYRKAMVVQEALKRLGDAAGTQLDERLVLAFVSGIETDATAPIPGASIPAGALWLPDLRVA